MATSYLSSGIWESISSFHIPSVLLKLYINSMLKTLRCLPSFRWQILTSLPWLQGPCPPLHPHFYFIPSLTSTQTTLTTAPPSNSQPGCSFPKLFAGASFLSLTGSNSFPERQLSCSLYWNFPQPSYCPIFFSSQLLWQLYFSCLYVKLFIVCLSPLKMSAQWEQGTCPSWTK